MLHRTTQGRIVYDRKTHYFGISDATRIIKRFLRSYDVNFIQLLDFYRVSLLFFQKSMPDFIFLAGTLDIKDFNDASLAIFSLLWDLATHARAIDANGYLQWIKTQVPSED